MIQRHLTKGTLFEFPNNPSILHKISISFLWEGKWQFAYELHLFQSQGEIVKWFIIPFKVVLSSYSLFFIYKWFLVPLVPICSPVNSTEFCCNKNCVATKSHNKLNLENSKHFPNSGFYLQSKISVVKPMRRWHLLFNPQNIYSLRSHVTIWWT